MLDTWVGRDSYSNSLLQFSCIDFYDVFFLAWQVIPVSRCRHCSASVSKHRLAAQIRSGPSRTAAQGLLIWGCQPLRSSIWFPPIRCQQWQEGVVKGPPSMGEGKSLWKNMTRSPKGFLSHHSILHRVLIAFRLSRELLLSRAGFPNSALRGFGTGSFYLMKGCPVWGGGVQQHPCSLPARCRQHPPLSCGNQAGLDVPKCPVRCQVIPAEKSYLSKRDITGFF